MQDDNHIKGDIGLSPESSAVYERASANLRIMIEDPVFCSLAPTAKSPDMPFLRNLEQIFSLSSEIVFIVSYPSGDIVYINPVAGKRMAEAGIDPSLKKINEYFSTKISGNPEIPVDKTKLYVSLLNSAPPVNMELRATRVPCGDTELIAVYARKISADTEDRHLLRKSEVQHRSTLNAIHDSVVVVDKEMNIVIYNDSFESLTAKSGLCEDFSGKKLMEIAPYLTGKLGLEYRFVFKSGESLDTIIKHNDGYQLKYYEVIKSPVFSEGEIIQVVTVLRDRTQKQNLEELKKEAFFQIEKNMEQFAILNDHIRNPLQAIVGLADLYGGDMGLKIISQAREINDIVTRLDAGWIESEKVRDMLSKHYGIKVKRRPNVESPIGMLRTDDVY